MKLECLSKSVHPSKRRAHRTGIEPLEERRLFTTYFVNGTGDDTTADAIITLREAITAANGNPGTDRIEFQIPTTDPGYDAGTGRYTITPASALPKISDSTDIDGSSRRDWR